jgi:hypothetical protein
LKAILEARKHDAQVFDVEAMSIYGRCGGWC